MFTARSQIALQRRTSSREGTRGTVRQAASCSGKILRPVALAGFLALALPGTSSAQATGTMQVGARVIPAAAAWAGLSEARLAVAASTRDRGRPQVRRTGLVHARTELRSAEGRRTLLVTLQHPHN
jgi:hypothetical protein